MTEARTRHTTTRRRTAAFRWLRAVVFVAITFFALSRLPFYPPAVGALIALTAGGLSLVAPGLGVITVIAALTPPLLAGDIIVGAIFLTVGLSATKYLAGHSDVLLGAVLARDPDLVHRIGQNRIMGGAIPGPMEAWIALRGLRTFPLRWERACANALDLAQRCSEHPAVAQVRHLGLSGDPGHALRQACVTTRRRGLAAGGADARSGRDRLGFGQAHAPVGAELVVLEHVLGGQQLPAAVVVADEGQHDRHDQGEDQHGDQVALEDHGFLPLAMSKAFRATR